MNPRRRIAMAIAAALFVLALPGPCPAQWPPPILPEDELRKAGLATDIDHLIEYLVSGFPVDFIPVSEIGSRDSLALYRGRYYRFAVNAAGRSGDQRAVEPLRRILAANLPSIMQADLDMLVASRPQSPTWADWDRFESLEKDVLKAEAAIALHLLTGESPEQILTATLRYWSHDIAEMPDAMDLRYLHWELFGLAYDSLLETNVSAAVEVLLSLLDETDPQVRARAADELRVITQQHFGPYHDSPAAAMDTEAVQWAPWWAEHGDEVLDRIRTNGSVPFDHPEPPDPVSVRDYVWWSITSTWNSDVPPPVDNNPGRIWLKAHAKKHTTELRAIALNRLERYLIRGTALKYLADHNPARTNDVLLGILEETTTYSDSYLQSEAIGLVKEHFPKILDDALKICLGNPSCAPAAANYLSATGGREILTSKLATLDPKVRDIALNELLYRPTFGAMETALAGDDPRFAARAVHEARHPSILAGLSPAAIERLAVWRNDAWCQYWILRERPQSELRIADLTVAMNAQRGVNPPAAAVFARVYTRTSDQRALDEFVRCVDAYRVSRGRTQSLKELGYSFLNQNPGLN